MTAGTPRAGGEDGESSSAPGLVLFRAGALIPIRLPCPDERVEPRKGSEAKTSGQSGGQAVEKEDARATLGHNLRWAFPLPDGGSFNQLLAALEEA